MGSVLTDLYIYYAVHRSTMPSKKLYKFCMKNKGCIVELDDKIHLMKCDILSEIVDVIDYISRDGVYPRESIEIIVNSNVNNLQNSNVNNLYKPECRLYNLLIECIDKFIMNEEQNIRYNTIISSICGRNTKGAVK